MKRIRRQAYRQRFIYRFDTRPEQYRKKYFKARFLSVRLTRLFFITIKDRQFRKMFIKARKLTGNLENNYCYLLEGRAIMILYRTLFVSNLFDAIKCLKRQIIFLD